MKNSYNKKIFYWIKIKLYNKNIYFESNTNLL